MARVWIVEDNDTIRECLAVFLKMEGFEVDAYAEGGVALQTASADPAGTWPELVFLDLYTEAMPALDFVEGLNSLALRLQRKPPKICVVSGAADIEELSQSLNADFFFQKPFSTSELIRYARRSCAQVAEAG
jgi:DNA-binding response OmpR family regulator